MFFYPGSHLESGRLDPSGGDWEDSYLFKRQFGLWLFTDIVSDVAKGCSGPQPGLGGCSGGHRHALCACYTDLRLIFSIHFRVLKEDNLRAGRNEGIGRGGFKMSQKRGF